MIELIYASAATVPFSSQDLAALLAKARQRNAQDDVSGMLLFESGSFLQVLEGEPGPVHATYQRIAKDPRHDKLILLKQREIETRSFGDWQMGFLASASLPAAQLEGFSDFLRGGAIALHGNPDAVVRILAAFRDGRYRTALR